MALTWLDLISDPRFASLNENQRRRFRENWLRDEIYNNPYVLGDRKETAANWFREKTEYTMEESFNPIRDEEEGWTPYMKAATHGVVKGLTGGWGGLGGRTKLYDTKEERAMMEQAGLPTEKKWGWIDAAEEHPWVALGGEFGSFAIPLGLLSKAAYIPRALRLATGATRATSLGLKLGRAGLRGAQVGAMYGFLKKPEGPEWEHIKSPIHAPWSDEEYVQQKVVDTLIDAGIFAGADAIGAYIGNAWRLYRQGNTRKAVREITLAANKLKEAGKLRTKRDAMYRVLRMAKEAGLEDPDIIAEVSKSLKEFKVPREKVPALVERWLQPTKKLKELEQLDVVFNKLRELGGARLVGTSKQMEVLKGMRIAHPDWSEEQLIQGVFDALKEEAPAFKRAFGEGWVPKFELRFAERPVPVPSRMGKEDLQSMVHNVKATLGEVIGEEELGSLGKQAKTLYDKIALLGTDLVDLNKTIAQTAKMNLPMDVKGKLYELFIHINSAKEGLRLFGTAPKDLRVLGEIAFDKWFSLINKGQLHSRWTSEIAKELPFLKDPLARRRIFYYLNDALKFGRNRYADFGILTDTEKKFGDLLRKEWDSLFQIARDAGLPIEYRKNYAPLIWKNTPDEIRRWMRTFDPHTGEELVAPRRRRLGQAFRHARQRKLELQDGFNLGLEPIEDPVSLMRAYQESLYRVLANKNLVEGLQATTIPFEGDLLPIMTHAGRSLPDKANLVWKRLDIEGLQGGVKIAPQFYNAIKDVFDPWIRLHENRMYRGWSQIRNLAKRVIMYNPLIHGANIISDVITEQLTLNPISWVKAPYKTWKTFTRGAHLWKTKDKIIEEAVLAGMNLEGLRGVGNELWEGTRRMVLRDVPATSFLGKVFAPAKGFVRLMDRGLWEGIVRNAQLGLYSQLKPVLTEVAKKQGQKVSQEVIQRATAHYINDLLGTLSPAVFSQAEREILTNVLFARNWTISNLRLITGALGITKSLGPVGTKNIFGLPAQAADVASGMINKIIPGRLKNLGAFNFLRHGGLDVQGMQLIQQRYVKHLVKGVFALVTSASLGQMMLCHATNYLKDKGILNEAEHGPKVPIHGCLRNPAGHRLDLYTGMVDNKQRPLYITNFLFRYIRDYFMWMLEPTKTLYNKWEPVSKGFAEVFTNQSLWRNETITPPGKGIAYGDWLKARGVPGGGAVGGFTARAIDGGKYILESATFLDQVWGTPGYSRKWWEWLPNLGGSYFRRGLTLEVDSWRTLRRDHKAELWNSLSKKEQKEMFDQWQRGVFKGNVARKLLDHRQKWDYEKSRIDKEIEELIQDGKFDEAAEVAQSTGRYLEGRYFKNRLSRYRNEWLNSIEKEEREREAEEEGTVAKDLVW